MTLHDRIVGLTGLDYKPTEIRKMLGCTAQEIRAAHETMGVYWKGRDRRHAVGYRRERDISTPMSSSSPNPSA